MEDALPGTPGTYALVVRCDRAESITSGRLGTLHLCPGYYVYVGSVSGPGDLRSRLGHHAGAAGVARFRRWLPAEVNAAYDGVVARLRQLIAK